MTDALAGVRRKMWLLPIRAARSFGESSALVDDGCPGAQLRCRHAQAAEASMWEP
jgi:hypothetical protein